MSNRKKEEGAGKTAPFLIMPVTLPNRGQHIIRAIPYTKPRWDPDAGDTDSVDMLEAQFAPKGRFSWRRHYVCQICGFTYPQDEVLVKGGLAYCYRFSHDQDSKREGGIHLQ